MSEQNLVADTSGEPLRHPQVEEAFFEDDNGDLRARERAQRREVVAQLRMQDLVEVLGAREVARPREGEVAQRHVLRQPIGDERYNAIGRLQGEGGGKSLMFNGHLDTSFGPEQAHRGLGYRCEGTVIDDEWIYGMGTFNMKSALATYTVACEAIRAAGITNVSAAIRHGCANGSGLRMWLLGCPWSGRAQPSAVRTSSSLCCRPASETGTSSSAPSGCWGRSAICCSSSSGEIGPSAASRGGSMSPTKETAPAQSPPTLASSPENRVRPSWNSVCGWVSPSPTAILPNCVAAPAATTTAAIFYRTR